MGKTQKIVAALFAIASTWVYADNIDSVLTRFPQQAFDVQIRSVSLGSVEYTVRWNTQYVQELGRAVDSEAKETEMTIPRMGNIPATATMCYNNPNSVQHFLHCGTQSYARVVSGKNWDSYPYLFGWNTTVGFNDRTRARRMLEILVGTAPQVKLTAIVASTGRQFRTCYNWPHLDHVIQYNVPDEFFVDFDQDFTQVSVNGQAYFRGISAIPAGLTDIRLQVVRQNQCTSI